MTDREEQDSTGQQQEGSGQDEQDQVVRKTKIVEPDPNDEPQKAQSQIPDVNPGKVQRGHRDREQI